MSKWFVVNSGYDTQSELGDRRVVVVEVTDEEREALNRPAIIASTNFWVGQSVDLIQGTIVIAESVQVEFCKVDAEALALSKASLHALHGLEYGPNAWEKASLEEAVGFALYRADYPGSEETCKIGVVAQEPEKVWSLLRADARFSYLWEPK